MLQSRSPLDLVLQRSQSVELLVLGPRNRRFVLLHQDQQVVIAQPNFFRPIGRPRTIVLCSLVFLCLRAQVHGVFDQNHAEKKARLHNIGKKLFVGGLVVAAVGLSLFLLGPLVGFFGMANSTHNPSTAIMSVGLFGVSAVAGVILTGVGSMCAMVSGALMLFTHSGDVARYHAEEQIPLEKEIIQDMQPVVNESIKGAVKAVRQGWNEGAPLSRFAPLLRFIPFAADFARW